MRLNIIHGRRDRHDRLVKELQSQNITDYELWNGIFLPSVKMSINAAHKQIVRYAKIADWPKVCIAEDDVVFSSPGSWKYFQDNLPGDYDIYLSMCFLGQPNENNIVDYFTGLTLYVVNSRFYDVFLGLPDDEHIDRALAGLGKYVVCHPFVAMQSSGRSSNTGKHEDYAELLKNRVFL